VLKNKHQKIFSQLLDQRDRFDNISSREAFSALSQTTADQTTPDKAFKVLIRRDGRLA